MEYKFYNLTRLNLKSKQNNACIFFFRVNIIKLLIQFKLKCRPLRKSVTYNYIQYDYHHLVCRVMHDCNTAS